MTRVCIFGATLALAVTIVSRADDAPLPKLWLRGTVLDQNGKPVVGADVYRLDANRFDADALEHTRTGNNGEFAFDVANDPELKSHGLMRPCLVAYKEDVGIGGLHGFRETLDSNARVVLAPVEYASIRFRDADGRPLKAARVRPFYLGGGQDYTILGKQLSEQLAVTLDAEGRGAVCYLPSRPTTTLLSESGHTGIQFHNLEDPREATTIDLKPVGRLTGRVTADDPSAAAGIAVQVGSFTTIRTDEQGRFEIPAVVAGKTQVSVHPEPTSSFLPLEFITANVEAGTTADVQLKLVRAVKLVGQVIDDAQEQPISGVAIQVRSQRRASRVTTDEQGQFATWVLPGEASLSVAFAPGLYLAHSAGERTEQVAEEAREHTVATLRLKKGIALTGRVIDEASQPISDAHLTVSWEHTDGRLFTIKWLGGSSEPDGSFVIGPVPPDVEIGIHGETNERATEKMVRIGPDQLRQPVALRLLPSGAVTVEGRVTDQRGAPVADARVRFRRSMQVPDGRAYRWGQFEFDGQTDLTTDANGHFATPFPVAEDRQWVVTAEADGFLSYESDMLEFRTSEPRLTLEPLVLQRELLAEGRVLDRRGAPITGARVWAQGVQQFSVQETTTDNDGRFRLEHLHPAALFLFVEHDDFRISGTRVPETGQSVDVVPDAKNDPQEPLRLVIHSPEQQRQWLAALIEPIFDELGNANSDYFTVEALRYMMPHDREFVVGRLDRIKRESSRAELLIALGEIDDGLAIAAQLEDPSERSQLAITAASAIDDRDRKRNMLADAYLHARSIERPERRIIQAAQVVKQLTMLGFHEEAEKIVEEMRPIAVELAPVELSGYARGKCAEALALFDSEAARQLAEPLSDARSRARHLGQIACIVAARDAEAAEQILGLVDDRTEITPYAVRVCYHMAAADLPRAKRIADQLQRPYHRAHAYGLMAMGLKDTDPQTARELLNAAFQHLDVRQLSPSLAEDQFSVAFVLLGFADVVDPERTRECFWRTLALFPPHGDRWGLPGLRAKEERDRAARLALFLAAYGQFPELQQDLVEPLFAAFEGYTSRGSLDFYRENASFMAMALCAPERAHEWHVRFHPKISAEDRRLIPQPWMTVAEVYGSNGHVLHGRITQNVFHLWTIGQED